MVRRPLVIRKSGVRIIAKDGHMKIINKQEQYIVAYCHVCALFIDKTVQIGVDSLMQIGAHMPIFFVDARGYLIVKLEKVDNNA